MSEFAYAHLYPDQDISLAVDYGPQWQGEVEAIVAPFVHPEDSIRESVDANPRPINHIVRIDGVPYDDMVPEMGGEQSRFPIGAAMAQGDPSLEAMDGYRLVFDGSHA